MRKILLILGPLLLAGLIFAGLVFFSKKTSDKGAIQVTSIPKSKVFLDGNLIGETPLCKCEGSELIVTGEYTLKLVPNDSSIVPFEAKVSISKSILTVVDRTFGKGADSSRSIITLSKSDDPKATEILVLSFPDKSDVLLDNTDSGTTPLLLKNVPESDHELRLIKDGYEEKVVRIRTVTGYRLSTTIFMGVNPNISTESAQPTASPSASIQLTVTPVVSLSPSVQSTASAQVTILQTPTGFLRVRSNASISAAEITKVYPGNIFDYVDEKSGWYEIKLKDGTTGWVSNQYAT